MPLYLLKETRATNENPPMSVSLEQLRTTIVAALEEIKAKDIVILDVRKLTAMTDTMIIASADSVRQTKALADNVVERVRALGTKPVGTEGEQTGEWILLDFGDAIVHIMQPAVRQYYDLEGLWGAVERQRKSAQV